MSHRPEISYISQNVLPLLTEQFDFPIHTNEEQVKIDEIPIRIGSGLKKPDIVYYANGVPVLILEGKVTGNPDGTPKEGDINQALSYVKNFPVESYSINKIYPKFFAVSVGRKVFWYTRSVSVVDGNIIDEYEHIEPKSFSKLVNEYGLSPEVKKRILSTEEFRRDLLGELTAVYAVDRKISPDVVDKVSEQLLSVLEWNSQYTSREPYISLDSSPEKQQHIRQIFNHIDLAGSIGPKSAQVYRTYILRSFQGQFNQYITEQSIIALMLQLVGPIPESSKILDFECGSGGFLAAVLNKPGLKEENIRGIDVNPLPYSIARTYMAIFFRKTTKDDIDALPIKLDNGLFYHGNDWDLVIGNPAGGSKYDDVDPKRNDLDKVLENLKQDIDGSGTRDKLSEYNFSIQQAVRSARVGGKICLILPEGFFANSQDEFLRKYVSKHCRVLAIVSLPRGAFKRGTTTSRQQSGSQTSGQKMTIFLAEKTRDIVDGEPLIVSPQNLNYPVFMAEVSEPDSRVGNIDEWLEPPLEAVAEQWDSWKEHRELREGVKLREITVKKEDQKTIFETEEQPVETPVEQKHPEHESSTTVSEDLRDIFQKEK